MMTENQAGLLACELNRMTQASRIFVSEGRVSWVVFSVGMSHFNFQFREMIGQMSDDFGGHVRVCTGREVGGRPAARQNSHMVAFLSHDTPCFNSTLSLAALVQQTSTQ